LWLTLVDRISVVCLIRRNRNRPSLPLREGFGGRAARDRNPLSAHLACVKIALEKISSDEGEGPKLTNALNAPSYQKIDVVVASTAGGNFMLDFFNSAAGWA
ncbi:hypothetical protein, partial [Vibrio cholerae]|uniref:hypothetical protein n=1 Tax=Vibrio cholerae TaxID=666 RepID=UPI00131EFD47